MTKRRDALILGAVGMAAAAIGALVSPVILRRQRGEAFLAAATFPDLAGKRRALSEWSTPALVCNFWATWCEPCREEIPVLIATREKYGTGRVEIVGIGIDHVGKMQQFAANLHIPYPLLAGESGGTELMRELGNEAGALPFTVVRDAHGAIRFRRLGRLRSGDLDPVLEAIFR